MNDITITLLGVAAGQLVALLIVIFKTYPVIQTKVETLEKIAAQSHTDSVELKKIVDGQTVVLARETQSRESIKRELDDIKQSMKEVNLELRKAVEDNTKAIITLETTLKIIGSSLRTNNP